MKKEILTIAFIGLLATTATTTLNASSCSKYLSGDDFSTAKYSACTERERRAEMSVEEGQVYDLEQKNELNRRQKAAEREVYEQKSTLEKAKSWFN